MRTASAVALADLPDEDLVARARRTMRRHSRR
jgi:hypothetical protein